MKKLDYELERMQILISSTQSQKLEEIKYNGRCNNGLKISKTELVRIALNNLFKLDFNEILNLVESNRDVDN